MVHVGCVQLLVGMAFGEGVSAMCDTEFKCVSLGFVRVANSRLFFIRRIRSACAQVLWIELRLSRFDVELTWHTVCFIRTLTLDSTTQCDAPWSQDQAVRKCQPRGDDA